MVPADSTELANRIEDRVRAWRITVERVTETTNSVLAFGQSHDRPVVLKVVKTRGDEWYSGAILDAFEGRGVARVYEYDEGAMLLERLDPGESLVSMAVGGHDEDATGILAGIIRTMSPRLFDAARDWLAIDPKGVIGELEYEVGAALRNPCEAPQVLAEPTVIRRRAARFARELGLDQARILSWAFALAVLAVIWAVEDGHRVEEDNGWIALAGAIRPMLNKLDIDLG